MLKTDSKLLVNKRTAAVSYGQVMCLPRKKKKTNKNNTNRKPSMEIAKHVTK